MTLEARAPAKVNLTLAVVGRREDGFHDLRSVMLRVGLSDRLTVESGAAGGRDRLTVEGLPDTPVADNTILRAIELVRHRVDPRLPALEMTLDKRIPLAAGLGGGSSDGAAALGLAQAFWGVRLAPAEEMALGAEVGSDVPFFVSDATVAEVGGRGEVVRALSPVSGELGVLLVTPRGGLSTAQVFARFDDREDGQPSQASDATSELAAVLGNGLDAAALCDWAEKLHEANDLWPAASSLDPSLGTLRVGLEAATARPWLMSGSGPTLFALYPSVASAVQAGRELVAGSVVGGNDAFVNATDLVGPDAAWRYP
jgi:4-diphosphocytidyl-2-C-methyl-D-erythritol kinase